MNISKSNKTQQKFLDLIKFNNLNLRKNTYN